MSTFIKIWFWIGWPIIGLGIIFLLIYNYCKTKNYCIKQFGLDSCRARDHSSTTWIKIKHYVRQDRPNGVFPNSLVDNARIHIDSDHGTVTIISAKNELCEYYPYTSVSELHYRAQPQPNNENANVGAMYTMAAGAQSAESAKSSNNVIGIRPGMKSWLPQYGCQDIVIPDSVAEEINLQRPEDQEIIHAENGDILLGGVEIDTFVVVLPEGHYPNESYGHPYFAVVPTYQDNYDIYFVEDGPNNTVKRTVYPKEWFNRAILSVNRNFRYWFYNAINSKLLKNYRIPIFGLYVNVNL